MTYKPRRLAKANDIQDGVAPESINVRSIIVRLSDKRSERATVMGVLGTKPARVLIVRQSCEATLHLTQMYQDDLYRYT